MTKLFSGDWALLWVVLIFALVWGGYGWLGSDNLEVAGREAAQTDIRLGRLKIKTVPDTHAWQPVAYRLLRERYGLQVEVTEPALWSQAQQAEWNRERKAYNAVMTAEVQRRYGKDVFERTELEARKLTGDWSTALQPSTP